MKKTFTLIFCAVIALPMVFTSCHREQEDELVEGVYNPEKKIESINTESRLLFGGYGGETYNYFQQWQWNGDLLESITYSEDGSLWRKVHFFYQDDRISSISVIDSMLEWRSLNYYYYYEGNKLTSIKAYRGSFLVEDYNIIHEGDKIVKILYSFVLPDTKERNWIQHVNLTDLPVPGSHIISKLRSKHENKGYGYQSELDLEWNGSNINTIYVTDSDIDGIEKYFIQYTYDNKNNPLNGLCFWYGQGQGTATGGFLSSRNNILSEKWCNSDGKVWSYENHTYTYNGEWPISERFTEKDDEYSEVNQESFTQFVYDK